MSPASEVVANLDAMAAWLDDGLGHSILSPKSLRDAAALISSLVAENEALSAKFNGIQTCGCAWDSPDDICSCHSPKLIAAQTGHAAARQNFLTMQGAAAKLLDDANEYKAAMLANYERALTAERLLAEARNALEPFADCASHYAQPGYNMLERVIHVRSVNSSGETEAKLTRGDFAIAAKARSSTGGVNG